VIPVEVRRALAIEPGDRLEFVLDDEGARLVTTHDRVRELWAKNAPGTSADDAGSAVRDERRLDVHAADAHGARVEVAAEAEHRSEDEITRSVLRAVGVE
jgi:bifunctional DNA-binding transcriptional regulator/antitoxin component of YhaV-PrlF toxin-antitoxin module